uniref:Uncharacterized protein n=1 Tax=Anguilla anguilla TaxID=7936 RepID=A0A0E9SX25_ANGAN
MSTNGDDSELEMKWLLENLSEEQPEIPV